MCAKVAQAVIERDDKATATGASAAPAPAAGPNSVTPDISNEPFKPNRAEGHRGELPAEGEK